MTDDLKPPERRTEPAASEKQQNVAAQVALAKTACCPSRIS